MSTFVYAFAGCMAAQFLWALVATALDRWLHAKQMKSDLLCFDDRLLRAIELERQMREAQRKVWASPGGDA